MTCYCHLCPPGFLTFSRQHWASLIQGSGRADCEAEPRGCPVWYQGWIRLMCSRQVCLETKHIFTASMHCLSIAFIWSGHLRIGETYLKCDCHAVAAAVVVRVHSVLYRLRVMRCMYCSMYMKCAHAYSLSVDKHHRNICKCASACRCLHLNTICCPDLLCCSRDQLSTNVDGTCFDPAACSTVIWATPVDIGPVQRLLDAVSHSSYIADVHAPLSLTCD